MGASTSLCKRRNAGAGSLEELGISESHEWDGLSEDRIDDYEEIKNQLMDRLLETKGEEGLPAGWVQQLPEVDAELLKMRLVRRAIGLVHVLRPIEEQRKGMRWLHSQGALSGEKWASYQQAEDECSTELGLLTKEAQMVSPESPPNILIRTAVQLYNSHGMNWPQVEGEFAVHPEATEIATMQLHVMLKREVGQSLGLSLGQEPPKAEREEGAESHLVVQGVLPDGFVHQLNESQSDPAKSIQPGDRIMAVVDCTVPEADRKPVAGDSEAMFHIMTKDQNATTPLLFVMVRQLGPPLRFKVGSRVKAHYGDKGWHVGTVVKLWEQHPNGTQSPYVVRLDEGQVVLAPRDSDECVLKLEGADEATVETPQHPEAKEMIAMNLQFVLKRGAGERLGLKLNHEPPLEERQPGAQSRLVVTGMVEGGYMEKFNGEQQEEAERLQPGDRIVGILNAGLPEEERMPVEGDSQAMLEVITKGGNSATPLVFNVVRALGPALRFRPGQRVKANVGETWQEGTVVKCWEQGKPYIIRLEKDQRIVVAPKDTDECVTKADPRFKVGDEVVANHENSYKKGEITAVGEGQSAYQIKLEDSSEIFAPADSNTCVRSIARFKIGDKVQANIGGELLPGIVEQVYHPMWVYAIRVEEKGLVYAPEDNDAFVVASSE